MATINNMFANSISSIFNLNLYNRGLAITNRVEGISWDNHNVFTRFITCDISQDEIEIPVVMRGRFEDYIRYNIASIPIAELVLPIIKQTNIIQKRTADSIIKLFFSNLSMKGMLQVKTSKNVTYYGGKGYILDEQFNPLFFATAIGHYVKDPIGNIQLFEYTEFRVYIHPNVLINASDLIGKCLIKKVLPHLLTTSYLSNNSALCVTNPHTKVKIIVEDVSRFFRTPTPMSIDFTNEEMNKLLSDKAQLVADSLSL